MDDYGLYEIKVGIYAFCALFALITAFMMRHKTPLPGAFKLPHAYAPERMLMSSSFYWGVGVLGMLSRPMMQYGQLHVEAIIISALMCVTSLALVARSVSKAMPRAYFALYSVLCWGGLISGVIMAGPSWIAGELCLFALGTLSLGLILVTSLVHHLERVCVER